MRIWLFFHFGAGYSCVTFCVFLAYYLSAKSGETPAALEQRFYKLEDLLKTDISVPDFFANRDMLLALLAESDKIQIEVKE